MITIEAGVLARMMKVAGQVVARKNTLPILDNVCLRARDGELELAATDLDVEYRERVPAQCEAVVEFTLGAARLGAIANAVPSDAPVTIEAGADHRAVVKSGRSRWQLPTLPAQDFPALPFENAEGVIEMNAQQLARMLERVRPFQSDEQSRYYLQGPLWHGEDGFTSLAATDGNCLARVIGRGVDWPDGAPEVILLPKGAAVLQLLGAEKGMARVKWNSKMVCFTLRRVSLVTKVIDGTFPDYRRVIPVVQDEPAVFDPENVKGAVSRIKIASDKLSNAVTVEPNGENGLELSMTSDDATSAREQVPAQVGGQERAGFNGKYLVDMLNAIGGDTVEMHQADAGAPARFQRTVDDGCVGVVMPMRV